MKAWRELNHDAKAMIKLVLPARWFAHLIIGVRR